MGIDKELFYTSHELKYPVVARPYTDDMTVQEKVYTKDEVVAMLTEIQLEIEELDPFGDEWSDSLDACNDIIQQKINSLKSESEESNEK